LLGFGLLNTKDINPKFADKIGNFTMKFYKTFLLLCLLAGFGTLQAQQLRGIVRDADRGLPLVGVSISLGQTADINQLAITTDANGSFFTDALAPGYYLCFFTLEGYEPLLIPEVRIASGKETVLDVAMRPAVTELPNVTIKATPSDRRALQALGEIPLTREQTQRFPATFFDPARLALAYPGVANTDDQSNSLSIRGNSPANLLWRLEGLDVVNPNHLSNAGTLGDRPTTSSGGVLLFSAQLLDNSSLLIGAYPAGYGAALGGIMDISLRNGNNTQHEFTAQAGLLGLDIAAEGPLHKKNGHSYLANYRYSTVGLLGQMGISFGGETISFQDLSVKLDFAGKKGGHWSVFAVGGFSENKFAPEQDSAAVEVFKDFFNIDYQSKTGILGASHWAPIGSKTSVKIAAAVSAQNNERRARYWADLENFEQDEIDEAKWSGSLLFSHQINRQNRLQAGGMLNRQFFKTDATYRTQPQEGIDRSYWTYQPWAAYFWNNSSSRTQVQVGLHSLIFPLQYRASFEPRFLLTQVLTARHRLSFSVGKYSQVASQWIQKQPDLSHSWQLSMRHVWNAAEVWTIRTALYWQGISDAAVSGFPDAFSMLNVSEGPLAAPQFSYTGFGENKGIELAAERYLNGGWFLLANTSIFDSRYQGSDRVWRSSRWDLNHIANLTAGKEWQRDQWPERLQAFGFNGRITWAGGQRAAPVDVTASAAALTTVYDLSNGYSEKLPDFIRLDLRVYWRRNIGKRRNSMFAMDFQNVSIRKNVAYRYFDPYTGRVETKEQLGLVPNLSWRLEF
jgi:hypothetical protein